MRVGVNTLFLIPGEVGGTETYLCETLDAICEHHPDVELILFTNSENDEVLRARYRAYERVSYCPLGFRATNRYSRIIREQCQLPGKVRSSRLNVLWSPGYTAPFFCACPQVVTIHDMQYKTFPQDLSFLARLTTDVLVKAAARRCQRVIAVSEFSKAEIVMYTAAQADKVDVTHEAADPSFAEFISESDRRERLSEIVPGAAPYILCVSNTYPHKNVHVLAQAFADLSDLDHALVIVGKPRLGEGRLRAAIAELPDPARVVRIDGVSREILLALYHGADCFVLPSLYEGFGLPVLEAMMAGVPVVTTRHGAIPEIGSECVSYVDLDVPHELARKIRETVGWSKSERRVHTQKARDHAGTFSWRKTAETTIASLRAALD